MNVVIRFSHLSWVVYLGTVNFEDELNRFEDIITSEPVILTSETVAVLRLNKFPEIGGLKTFMF